MKKFKMSSKRFLSLFLFLVMVSSTFVTSSFAATTVPYSLTENEIASIEKAWESHGWVLKWLPNGWWPNNSDSGRRAIKGVETILQSLGYHVDTVDGVFDKQLHNVITQFQKDHDLSPDSIVGNLTFKALVSAASEANKDSENIKDLKVTAPTRVEITAGKKANLEITFSGSGIDSIGRSIHGNGLSATFQNVSWIAYPGDCKATIQINASDAFSGEGVLQFKLLNNSAGVIKTVEVKIVSVRSNSTQGLIAAVLNSVKKELGMTGKKLGYTVPWCAYYVSDILRENGVKITRAANPRDLVINALNAGKAEYYSFRSENTATLKTNGLKRTDLVTETTRSAVTPQEGDILCYLWEEDRGSYNWSHTGFVQSYNGKQLTTLEGNTSGGIVAERTRAYDATVIGILRLS